LGTCNHKKPAPPKKRSTLKINDIKIADVKFSRPTLWDRLKPVKLNSQVQLSVEKTTAGSLKKPQTTIGRSRNVSGERHLLL